MKIVYHSIFLAGIAVICYGLIQNVKVDILGQSVDIGTGGISVTRINDTVTFGRPECKNCTDYISGHIGTYRTALAHTNITYIMYNKIQQCANCILKYIETVNLYGDACVTPVPNQPNKTDTTINLQWDNITVYCQCYFVNQLDILDVVRRVQNLTTLCGNNQTTVDTSLLTDSAKFIASNNALAAFLSCITESGGNTFNPMEPLNITVEWFKCRFRVVVRKDYNIKGPRSSSFVDGGIFQRNLSDIHVQCDSNAIETIRICKCLVDSRILPALLDDIAEIVINCVFNQNSPPQQLVYDSYLACSN